MPFKEATFWYGTILSGTGIYFWAEGGARVTAGVILTVAGVLMSAYAVLAHHNPTKLPKLRLWVVALLITWMALGYDIYDRHHPHYGSDPLSKYAWDDNKPLERIYSPVFTNETVVLDGKEFISPTFDNVTFVFNGTGGVRIDTPKWINHDGKLMVRFASRNHLVTSAISLYKMITEATGCTNQDLINLGPNGTVNGVLPPDK